MAMGVSTVCMFRIYYEHLPDVQIDQEFALGVAKGVAEARRKVLEGVGKGIGRICATYAHQ